MQEIKGARHVHPLGEIDLIMPIDAEAELDGHGGRMARLCCRICTPPCGAQGTRAGALSLNQGQIQFT